MKKNEVQTANSIANKIDEILKKHGLPPAKRVTKTGYCLIMILHKKQKNN